MASCQSLHRARRQAIRPQRTITDEHREEREKEREKESGKENKVQTEAKIRQRHHLVESTAWEA